MFQLCNCAHPVCQECCENKNTFFIQGCFILGVTKPFIKDKDNFFGPGKNSLKDALQLGSFMFVSSIFLLLKNIFISLISC